MNQEIKVPFLGADNEIAIITSVDFKNGEFIKKNQIIFTIESSKTSFEIVSDFDGYINTKVKLNQEVKSDDILAELSDKIIEDQTDKNKKVINQNYSKKISPKAELLIKKNKIKEEELKKIKKKFITEKDVSKLIKSDEKYNKNKQTKEDKINLYKKTFDTNLELSKQKVSRAFISANLDAKNLNGRSNLDIILLSTYKALKNNQDLRILYNNERSILEYDEPVLGLISEIDKKLLVFPISISKNENEKTLFKKRISLQLNYQKNKNLIFNFSPTFNISYLESAFVQNQFPVVFHNHIGTLGIINNKKHNLITLTLAYNHFILNGKRANQFIEEICSDVVTYID